MGAPSQALIDRARMRGQMSAHMRNEELLFMLCHRVSPGVGTARTLLLHEMAEQEWEIARGPHVSEDQNMHVLIRIGRANPRGYHLQMDGAGVIFRITPGRGEVLGNEPSSAPGAAPGTMRRG
jgi:hypothetical protein